MLIISNPHAGKKQGPDFIRQHVTWFIDEFLPPTVVPEVKQTTKEGDAGVFALEYIKQNIGKDQITILVSGGDTTIHEIIQHLETSLQTKTHLQRVDIALLPMGTANALYYSEFPPERTEDICKTFDPRVQRRLATLDKETRSNLLSLSALCSGLPSTPLTIARSSIYDAKGTLLSHSPTTYKVPAVTDVPAVFNLDFLENLDNTMNVYGSKAVGEPPLLLGVSVFTAVKHALRSAVPGVTDRPGRVAKLDLPATGEEVLRRLTEAREPDDRPAGNGATPRTKSINLGAGS